MRVIPEDVGIVYFIGIGGIGMSGIAEILHNLKYKVRGSDLAAGANVERLRALGIDIAVGHKPENLADSNSEVPAVIVISSAVKSDNPELQAARQAGLPVVRRAEMLAELMRLKWAIAIGGTHGKTTTTSMVGQMLETAGFDPTVINGGIVNAYGSNIRLGQSQWLVAEADESDGTFTRLPASVAVVTNIDPEHMEHYGSFDKVKEAYQHFIKNLPFYGYAVLCTDHPEVQALIPYVSDRRLITYGFNPQADVQAIDISHDKDGSRFHVVFSEKLTRGAPFTLQNVKLPMLGQHNVQNSLVSLAVAYEMGVKPEVMKQALAGFSGVKRRFTKTGEINGITIIDDYAHHPVEIETVLKTARNVVDQHKGHIICVMQPHRYSRLHELFDGFCSAFNEADIVIIANVYAAGEKPIEGADKETLVKELRTRGHKNVQALTSRENLASMIAQRAKSGDYVICMGAGDITAWAYALPGELQDFWGQNQGAA